MTTTTSSSSSSFPIGSSVLLQNLVNGSQFNDKKGIVKSQPNANSGRQEVYIFEAQKSMSIKPANLRYEPRELLSLSISEMKNLLQIYKSSENNNNNNNNSALESEWSGMDKQELRLHVRKVIGSTTSSDPVKIAELVARSNEPKDIPTNSASESSPSLNSSQLRQGAERMSQMSPDDIRRQAATMKAMGPAALRAMNPPMAHMSDEQITMAIAQMESVASDPNQLKMAAEQMKNMSEEDLRRAMNLAGGGTSSSSSSTHTPLASSASSTSNNNNKQVAISKTQFEHAAQQMSSFSPTQLRQQAAMLRSVPYDTLRKTNAPMAHMTDSQIEMSIKQLEQMAENPELMKMATDQLKSMTEEQYESMKQMLGGGDGSEAAHSTSGGGANNNESMPQIDPSNNNNNNIMEGLLSNPEQLNSIVRTMKKNPELLKQVMVSQFGGGGPNNKVPDKQKEQLTKAIDSFVQMDDEKMERYLSMANGVQRRILKPMVTTLDIFKKRSGLSTRTLILLIAVGMFAVFGIVVMKLWMWWNGSGGAVTMMAEVEDESGMVPQLTASYEDINNEF